MSSALSVHFDKDIYCSQGDKQRALDILQGGRVSLSIYYLVATLFEVLFKLLLNSSEQSVGKLLNSYQTLVGAVYRRPGAYWGKIF